MKSFGDLTLEEKQAVVENAKTLLIDHVTQGVIKIEMPNKRLQRDLEVILAEMRQTEMVSVAKEKLVKNVQINAQLDRIAIMAVEGLDFEQDNKTLM